MARLNAFVVSNFIYCPPLVWHMCSIAGCLHIEKVQERPLHCVLRDFNDTKKTVICSKKYHNNNNNNNGLYLTRINT